MGVNSLPKTVTRQRRNCDLNPGPSASESSTLTTRLPSHPLIGEREVLCDEGVCLSVCVCLSMITCLKLHVRSSTFFVCIIYGRGSVILCLRSDKLLIFYG